MKTKYFFSSLTRISDLPESTLSVEPLSRREWATGASDPYAVTGVTKAFGNRPDLVTGLATSTSAGIELVEKLSGIKALNVLDQGSLPQLRAILRDTLGL
jgi:hypothetical protein